MEVLPELNKKPLVICIVSSTSNSFKTGAVYEYELVLKSLHISLSIFTWHVRMSLVKIQRNPGQSVKAKRRSYRRKIDDGQSRIQYQHNSFVNAFLFSGTTLVAHEPTIAGFNSLPSFEHWHLDVTFIAVNVVIALYPPLTEYIREHVVYKLCE